MNKTKTEIINETVAHYQKHYRSLGATGDSCEYLNKNGRKCAFSRCCTDEGVQILHNRFEGTAVNGVSINGNVDSFLKPEYKGHNLQFWTDIQNLHDTNRFWFRTKLTSAGKEYVERLLENYKD